jgi:hypothetical protein
MTIEEVMREVDALAPCAYSRAAFDAQALKVRAAILALLDESDGPWKAAVIDGLVVSHCYQLKHETDPRKALDDLISWHVMVALDPSVSSDAVKLLDAEAQACAVLAAPDPNSPWSERCDCRDHIRARIDARKGGAQP